MFKILEFWLVTESNNKLFNSNSRLVLWENVRRVRHLWADSSWKSDVGKEKKISLSLTWWWKLLLAYFNRISDQTVTPLKYAHFMLLFENINCHKLGWICLCQFVTNHFFLWVAIKLFMESKPLVTLMGAQLVMRVIETLRENLLWIYYRETDVLYCS